MTLASTAFRQPILPNFAPLLTSIKNRLSKKTASLFLYDDYIANKDIQNHTFIGRQTVPLQQIRGSLTPARCKDFDAKFQLRNKHGQGRLQRVQAAMHKKSLPPVALIQVGNTYFVQDGHHRVSLANCNQQSEIQATVTIVA